MNDYHCVMKGVISRFRTNGNIGKSFHILLFLFFLFPAAAQMNLRQLSVNNGLSQYRISDICQDSYGFIWIATYDGLNRYDGISCRIYRQNPDNSCSLSSNRIKSLHFDNGSGRLFVGTDGGGINIYDYAADSFKTYNIHHSDNDWLPENDIIDIKPEMDGRIWVATRRAIFLVEITDDDIFVIQEIAYPTTRVINSLISTDSTMFAIAKRRIVRYVKNDGVYVQDSDRLLPDNAVNSSAFQSVDGSFFFATDKGIYSIDAPSGTMEYKKEDICGDGLSNTENVTALGMAGDRMYFIVNEKGLFCRDCDGHTERIRTGNGNFWLDNTVKSCMLDHSNTLWMGSLNKGAGIIDLEQIKYEHIDVGNEDCRPFISELMFDMDGDRLWIGTQKNGLFIRDNDGCVRKTMLNDGNVTDIRKFSDGSVKIVCDGHVYSCRNGSFNEIFPLEYDFAEEAGTIFTVCEDSSGAMWLGCRKGIVHVGNDAASHIRLETNFHIDVIPSRSGDALWVCTGRNGLLRYGLSGNSEVMSEIHYTCGGDSGTKISSNTVMCLFETSRGEIYAGTEMGLDKIDGNTLQVCRLNTSGTFLKSCRIIGISEDGNGILWVNTNKGVVRYNPSTGEENIYDSSDGLVSNFTTTAPVISGNGTIYVGTNEGITSFCTTDCSGNGIPPKIAVSGFKVFGENVLFDMPVMDKKEIVLPYNHNSITFELSIFSYNNPHKNKFEYRLTGYDDDWITVGANHPYASYSKLKKGHYTFEFRGTSNNGIPSDETIRIEVIVKPAWWDTIFAYVVYVLFLTGILFIIVQYAIDRMRRKAEHEANEAKLRFYDNLTHELRTPLTLITAPLSELAGRTDLPGSVLDKLSIMQRNADRLMDMVNHFLELRKVDSRGLPLRVKEMDTGQLLEGIIQRFEPFAAQKRISLHAHMDDGCTGFIDEEKMTIIITNLLSNAIKFTESGGTVSVSLKRTPEELVIEVEDNGSGISRKDLAHIFERFYQVENRPVSGTGIGLELSRSLAELHKGSLSGKSRLGEGSVFTLRVPYRREMYSEAELGETGEHMRSDSGTEVEEDTVKILIVEDDPDMQGYIKSLMPQEYQTITACNGKEGLETTLETMPDIVISDVMMPVMDGMEMCRRINNDYRTSHIPVILLTAKNDEYSGLSSGAIDYIMKPFAPQSLLLKIRNLLHYRDSHRLDPDKRISIARRISEYSEQKEKDFLDKALRIVEENIGNSEFNVNDLMKGLGVSKTQLHKKITTLTGAPASAFIRNIRLDKAREMLETGQYSITEVLYTVGFSSPSYFSKTFRERFGTLPSDMLEDK